MVYQYVNFTLMELTRKAFYGDRSRDHAQHASRTLPKPGAASRLLRDGKSSIDACRGVELDVMAVLQKHAHDGANGELASADVVRIRNHPYSHSPTASFAVSVGWCPMVVYEC